MAASNEMLFVIMAIGIFILSSIVVVAFNFVFSRVKRFLLFCYILILSSFIYFWFVNYWGRLEMNSASVNFSSDSITFQFSPKRDGKYNVSLAFLNDKTNDFFKKCEFFWLDDSKNRAECENALIYKKIMVNINNKIIHGQYHYREYSDKVFHYGYSHGMIDQENPSLNLATLILKKNEIINLKVSIEASSQDILKDQLILTIGPDATFYYAGISSGLLLLIISIPILISIIYFGMKLKK